MRIFVVGGTGVVGRRVVPALVASGHELTVLARSDTKASQVAALGGVPVRGSLFDRDGMVEAVAGHEAVINVATSIPPFSKALRPGAWRMNDRIRAEGAGVLADAAIAAGARRYVQESVSFLYVDAGSSWIEEDHPVRSNSITASALEAEAHARRVGAQGADAVVLRFGMFYGPDSGHTGTALRLARWGLSSLPGPRNGFVSALSTDDAASAVIAAVTEADAGVYNVVDDEPVTRVEFDNALAHAVGRDQLHPMPRALLRLAGDKLDHVTRSQRVSNRAFRENTDWRPRYPSVRQGLPDVAAGAPSRDR